MILEQDVTHKKVEVDAQTGTEKVVDEKHEVVRAPDTEPTRSEASKTAGKPPAKPATTAKKKGG